MDFIGTQGDDTLDGTDDNDNFEYSGGVDVYQGGLGNDIFEVNGTDIPGGGSLNAIGGQGNDQLRFSAFVQMDVTFQGGAGNDTAFIIFGDTQSSFVLDMGEGDDVVAIGKLRTNTDFLVNGEFEVSLGAGQDLLSVGDLRSGSVTITDFETGDAGDEFFFSDLELFENWDGDTNLFATGHLELVQRANDVILLVVFNTEDGSTGRELVTFLDTNIDDFTSVNFGGLPPDGSAATGETISGTENSETLNGTIAGDTITGLGGDDIINGLGGDDILNGGDGFDQIMGGAGDDLINGGERLDSLNGGFGNDRLFGGAGDDRFVYEAGNDIHDGGEGNDRFDVSSLGNGDDATLTLIGGNGEDELVLIDISSFENLTFDSGSGDDVASFVFGDENANFNLILGDGNDRVDIGRNSEGSNLVEGHFNVSLGDGADVVTVSSIGVSASSIIIPLPNFSLTISDFEVGDDGDVISLDFSNSIGNWDGSENPFEIGAARLLQIGNDTHVQFEEFSESSDSITSTVIAWADVFVLQNVIATELTMANLGGFDPSEAINPNQTINGNGFDNILSGAGGNDQISGFIGNDQIFGYAGDDQLLGDAAASLTLDGLEGQLFRAFQAVFDRAPDAGGFNAFLTELRLGNTTQEAVIAEFVTSAEFQNTFGALDNQGFVEQLFRNVLDREGDAAGIAAFTAALDGGRERASVVTEFANSAEFVQLMTVPSAAFATNVIIDPAEAQVFRIFQAVFLRDPDEGGFTAFTNSIQAGVLTVQEITAEFVGSAEFQQTYGDLDNAAFVELLFTNVLPGNTDAQGRANFTEALDAGTLTRAGIVAEFVESFEFVQRMSAPAEAFVASTFTSSGDVLDGGAGNDILFGGRGADSFVFDTQDGGMDTVLYFTSGTDTLDLGANADFDSFAEIMAAGSQAGQDTVFDFGDGNTLTLENVILSELTEADFGLLVG